MAKVKALLFTIGLMMLSLVILSLTMLIFDSFQESELIMSDIAALDRIYDLDLSIQNVLKNLFDASSGINLIVDTTNDFISFEETIPSNNTVFNLTLMNFKNFTYENFDYIRLNLDRVVKELPLIILPYNIEYKHLNFGERTIEIIPGSINFNIYEVFLNVYEEITSCPSIYSEETNFDVYVQATASGSQCSSRKIELDIENRVSAGSGFIYIRADSDGKLVIIANNTKAKVKTKIWFDSLDNAIVEYPGDIINISLTEIGISKTSGVRLR